MSDAPGENALGPESPRRARGPHSDLVIAAVIVAFAALVWFLTLSFDGVPAVVAGGMSPETFPRLLAGILVVLAAVLAFMSRGSEDEAREPVPWLVYATAGSFLFFMGLVWLIGMVAAMAVAVVGIGRLWGERRLWLLALIGVVLAVGIRVLFLNGFGIPLPGGWVGRFLG